MLYNPTEKDWDWQTIDALGLPRRIFTKLDRAGALRGTLRPELAAELGINQANFAAVGTHDTASAVAAIPGTGSFAFCSSGTWSLFGVETDEPILTDAVRDANFSNEGTIQGGFRPLRNIMGLWLIQECRRDWIKAGRKSRQMLHRAKKRNPDAAVVAAGCYVQTKEDEAKCDEAIDILIGNNQKKELVERLDAFFAGRGEKVEAVVDINHEKQAFEELTLDHAAEHTRAFIKVQDGCNQFCSYCIIPYARGRVRSRNVQNVLEEVKRLAASGYQEVVLTGIHLSSYGIDCGESLLHLIQMVHQVEGIRRIRLGSLEPRIVTETFAEELAKMEKICPHFHLSLQSGCDATLARMNRKYTTEEYENACNILRKNFTHPAITTDVIVGFPGETEEEFAQTKEYLKRIHFYEMHIFKYSRRQGTRAAVMEHQVPEEIKTKRSAQLLALAESMSREFRAYYVGKEEEVLFEEPMEVDGETWYTGYTKEYVKIAAKTEEPLDNVMKRGRVEAALTDEIYRMKL